MKKLRVLITNNTINARAGTELVVLELAKVLRKRGHKPVVYSLSHGEVSKELNEAGIPTIDNLSLMKEPPDIIHGHHHIEAMTAMLHFNNTPAIYVCHGFLPWQESPPIFTNIIKYIAVGNLTKERIVISCGVEESSVSVIRNWVDLKKFTLKNDIPIRPKKAVIFSNYVKPGSDYAKLIQSSCLKSGINTIDIVGLNSRNPIKNPEDIIQNYDLVFAVGRSALEAISMGCAVIISDIYGVSEMITPENFERQYGEFGLPSLDANNLSEDYLINEIGKYDHLKIKEVSNLLRSKVSIDDAVDQYEELYYQTMNSWDSEKKHSQSSTQMLIDASNYLAKLSQRIKKNDLLEDEIRKSHELLEHEKAKMAALISALEKKQIKIQFK